MDLNGEIYLIGAGPFISSYQMICRYFKFSLIKLFFFIIVIGLDKLLSFLSKDWFTYYCGTHISAVKK